MVRQLRIILILANLSCMASAFDLAYTYQQALSYNADYLKAVASNEAGQEAKNIARAALFPQILASGTMSENYFNQGGINAYYHQPTYSGSVSQVAFDFSKFSVYSKAKYASLLSDLQLADAKQQLLVSVSQAYFDVLYAEDSLASIQMTKAALEKQMNQAKKSFEVGTVTIADVNDAQAGYDSSAAQEIQAINEVINKKNIFRNLTGLDPEQISKLKDEISLSLPNPASVNKWSELAESANLNIKIAQQQVAMADQDVNLAIAGHLPTLTANLQYQYQDTAGLDASNATAQQLQNLSIAGSPLSSYATGTAGAQLNIPIFSGGGVNAQVRQARANCLASKQQLSGVQRTTDQNTRNTYWQVQNGVSIVKAQLAALKSAKIKLNSDQLGYQVGVRNSVDLVNSQKNYYQTYQTYQQSRYQYLLAKIQLRYLSSSIDDKFIQTINADIK